MIINYLGLSLFELGRYEESIKCFDVAIEIYPYDFEFWNKKGKK